MSLDLDPTPDILAEVGRKKGDRLLVGFAAETENLVESARAKLESKNCDMVVANLVNQEGTGFEVRRERGGAGAAHRRNHSARRALPSAQIAGRIFDQVLKLRLALHARNDKGPTPTVPRVLSGSRRQNRSTAGQPPSPAAHSHRANRQLPSFLPSSRPDDSLLKILDDIGDCKRCRLHEGRNQDRLRIRQSSKRGWCSSAKARAPTRTRRACRSSAAPANCSRR